MNDETPDDPKVEQALARVEQGDADAIGPIFAEQQASLVRLVRYRLDDRLRGRLDATDVVQETFLEATRRLPEFARERRVPFHVWLRLLAREKIIEVTRRHLHAKKRSAERDGGGVIAPVNSSTMALQLTGGLTGPAGKAQKAEAHSVVAQALDDMNELDREILTMRHIENRENVDVAAELGLDAGTASKRYTRALARLAQAVTGRLGDSGNITL